MSPDASGESVYMGNCIIPIYRDESLTLRINKRSGCYMHMAANSFIGLLKQFPLTVS